MTKTYHLNLWLTRHTYAATAVVLLMAIVILAVPNQAYAAQFSDRKIEMSDSSPSGGTITSGVGSGTKVAYKLSLSIPTTGTNVGGVVVDFCSNSPLVGDTCTPPTAFTVNRSSTTLYNQTGFGTGSFNVLTSDATNNRIIITRTTATAPTATASIEFGNGVAGTGNGFTNPSTTGSFYARIYTYPTAATATSHNTATPTGYTDYGGLALTTATVITITARVQETLIFCVSAASPSANCAGTTTPALAIGHGTNKVIDATAVDSGAVYSQLSTNAGNGATVRMRNGNGTCGGLSTDGGTTCSIPPANSGAATTPGVGTGMTAGTAAFGLAIGTATGTTVAAPYNGNPSGSNYYYGMDSTTAGSNVTTTYGSKVYETAGPVSNVNSTWTFAATASNTTAAGLYSANISAIATGQF